MKKILVAINSLVSTTHLAYSNHIQFFYRLGRTYTEYDFVLFNPSRMGIDRMRNMASTIAMDLECDYLLFLDDDVLVPIDSLQKLLDTDADIAAGHVIIRGYPFDNMFFKYTDSSKKELLSVKDKDLPEVPGVIDVDAVGFSLCLIKTELLRKVPAPHFITGVSNTEDIYFCLKSKEIKSNLSMVVDTSIRCGHILWSEVVSPDNKEDYSKYYLTQNTDAAKPKEKQDRSSGYNGIIHQLFGLFK